MKKFKITGKAKINKKNNKIELRLKLSNNKRKVGGSMSAKEEKKIISRLNSW